VIEQTLAKTPNHVFDEDRTRDSARLKKTKKHFQFWKTVQTSKLTIIEFLHELVNSKVQPFNYP